MAIEELEATRPNDDEVLTVPDICTRYKVSKSWVYEKIQSGELPHVVMPGGRLIRVPLSALRTKLGL